MTHNNTMQTGRKILLIFILLCACVAGDQATKCIAKQHLASSPPVSLLAGTIVLHYTVNHGSFLGLGARLPETVRFWLFIVLAGLLVAGMLGFVLTTHELNSAGVTGAALIIGGGFSNLLDRIYHNGAVVDFANIGIGSVRTGIFNLADVAIMAGIGLLLFEAWRLRETTQNGGL